MRTRVAAALAVAVAVLATTALTGCGASRHLSLTVITTTQTDVLGIVMEKGAVAEAARQGVAMTVDGGETVDDVRGQARAVDAAVRRGDDGIVITPNGPGVGPALRRARAAGVVVVATVVPPVPAAAADLTLAPDERATGRLAGRWTAGRFAGGPVRIALLQRTPDLPGQDDGQRRRGFLAGMGIAPRADGTTAPAGRYAGGRYAITCDVQTDGTGDGAQVAMRTCLAERARIDVVVTTTEPIADGVDAALREAGTRVPIVSMGGTCVGIDQVRRGVIGATVQQYPYRSAEQAVRAVVTLVRDRDRSASSAGRVRDSGATLVTDTPVDGVASVTSATAAPRCWG